MNLSNNLYYKKKLISSWNETYAKKAIIFYPKNLKELKNLLKSIKNNKKTYIIRTGTCAYDSKSINPDDNTYVISLKYFDKIIKISLNKKNILVECGAKISDVVKYLKSKNFSLFSPVIFPYPYNKLALYFNKFIYVNNIKKWIEINDLEDAILICFLPSPINIELIKHINFKKKFISVLII